MRITERERIRKLEAQAATLSIRGNIGRFSRVSDTASVPAYRDSVYWTKTLRFTNETGKVSWELTLRDVKKRLHRMAVGGGSNTPYNMFWWESISLICATAYGPMMASNFVLDTGLTMTGRYTGVADLSMQARIDLEASPGTGNYPDYTNLGPQKTAVGVNGRRCKLHWTWSDKDQGCVWQLTRITDGDTQSGGVAILEIAGLQGTAASEVAIRQDWVVDLTVKLWTRALQLTYG